MIVALAGGVGAAKFLRGLARAIPPEDLTVIVNTGDDIVLHGLQISPDIDSVTYALAGQNDAVRGWGLKGETWNCLDGMRRYGMTGTWFQLGDRDLATHLYRTRRREEGASLTEVTAEIAAAWGVRSRILPMTEDVVENRVVVPGHPGDLDLHFQEYLIERGAADPVKRVYIKGISAARPLPEAIEALERADGIVFCPSNPVVSIGPILSITDYAKAIAGRRCRAVGISPIVNGAPVRGPADRLMPAIGLEVSCIGVARAYQGLLDAFVIDAADARHAAEINATYLHCEVAQTMMTSLPASTHLARVVLDLLTDRNALGPSRAGAGVTTTPSPGVADTDRVTDTDPAADAGREPIDLPAAANSLAPGSGDPAAADAEAAAGVEVDPHDA